MSLADMERFLRRHKVVGLDSNILIYLIEAHPQYQDFCKKIFTSIESGRNLGICSTVSLLEILVQPYRKKDDETVNRCYGLLTTYPHLAWVELSVAIADLAAQLRAQYRLKTPDAIILATALDSGATGLIANDVQLKRVAELELLVLN
ncbi:MAG: PIN domain-containing protein [Gammaproteobacteria bacterium]|nr:PIN domain-containing protein [Gammaproteobacteria bacterium]